MGASSDPTLAHRETTFRARGGSRVGVSSMGDCRKCQTSAASPAEPGASFIGLVRPPQWNQPGGAPFTRSGQDAHERRRAAAASKAPIMNYKVLVVDDSKLARMVMASAFRRIRPEWTLLENPNADDA